MEYPEGNLVELLLSFEVLSMVILCGGYLTCGQFFYWNCQRASKLMHPSNSSLLIKSI